jgi:hypothetical protein
MRSKVKRLVEKPDKDPSKLPRAEKEAEMVSVDRRLDLLFTAFAESRLEMSSYHDNHKQTIDHLPQAKAAYEQLNQQLTDELPQLIDLRSETSHLPPWLIADIVLVCLTLTPRSKPWSRFNYASAQKHTPEWRKCNSTSLCVYTIPGHATNFRTDTSTHQQEINTQTAILTRGWRMCWDRFVN